jgi:DNA replication initiation complex subunit (GINS family)
MLSTNEKAVKDEFYALVNMRAGELEAWLGSRESKTAGQKDGPGPSIGQRAGMHILEILRKRQGDCTEEDLRQMRQANGVIKRHLAQRPEKDLRGSRWRYALMNWGHDPLK